MGLVQVLVTVKTSMRPCKHMARRDEEALLRHVSSNSHKVSNSNALIKSEQVLTGTCQCELCTVASVYFSVFSD